MIYHITYKLNFYFYRKYDVIYYYVECNNNSRTIDGTKLLMHTNIPAQFIYPWFIDDSSSFTKIYVFTTLCFWHAASIVKSRVLPRRFVRAWTLFSREKNSLGLVVFCAYLCNGRVVLTTVSRFSNEGYRCEVIEKRRMRIEKNCFRFSTLLHYFVTSE